MAEQMDAVVGEGNADSGAIMKWAVIGSIVGFILVGGIFGLSVYLFSDDVVGAVAVGVMTGLLGGPGFGGMMGFVVQYSKRHEHPVG